MAIGDPTASGWPTQPNLAQMAAVGQPTYANTAVLTPAQQQAQRQRLYAQALLNQTSSAPQRSGWGALNQALTPIIGGYMMPGAQTTPAGPGPTTGPSVAQPGYYAPM